METTTLAFPEAAKIARPFHNFELRVVEQGGQVLIEAIGPNGERAASPTVMPNLNSKPVEPNGLDSSNVVARRLEAPVLGQPIDDGEKVKMTGKKLGMIMMPQPVLQLYTDISQQAFSAGEGIRIKLVFVGTARRFEQLAWEKMKVNGQSITKDPRVSIVRSVESARPALSFDIVSAPYRILVATASPNDQPLPQLEREVRLIAKALQPLAQQGLVEIVPLLNASLDDIASTLASSDFHIFHFAGHASNRKGDGALVLIDEEGNSDLIGAEKIAPILIKSGVRVVVLNAMQTAYGENSLQAKGAAEIMLAAGMPAVIAYNNVVYDDAAIAFASAFYATIAEVNSIELAVFNGRKAVVDHTAFKEHWNKPLLFMRKADTKIWQGNAGFQIETFMKAGKLVTEARPQNAFNPQSFSERLNRAIENVGKMRSQSERLQVLDLLDQAKSALANGDTTNATKHLSNAFTRIYTDITEQEKEAETQALQAALAQEDQARAIRIQAQETAEQKETAERKARRSVLTISLLLLSTIVALAYYFGFDDETGELQDLVVPILGIPISVIVWSFIGGFSAILHPYVGSRRNQTAVNPLPYEWLLWRPIIGVVMGSVVYLAIAAGLYGLGQEGDLINAARPPYLLWALSFLGGFSDRFALAVFSNFVSKYSSADTVITTEEASPIQAPPTPAPIHETPIPVPTPVPETPMNNNSGSQSSSGNQGSSEIDEVDGPRW